MALTFSQVLTLIQERFRKPAIGQKIAAVDSEDVATEILNHVTNDGSSLPPYSKPNGSVGVIPQLSSTYQYSDSKMTHFSGLGGGVRLDGAWRLGNNALLKTELFQPTAHATNRYETRVTIPKGNYGLVTLEVTVRALGQSVGFITKVFTFNANTNSGAASVVLQATGDITTKLYLDEPDWSGASIIIPLYEKSAVNSTKIYVVDVAIAADAAFMTALLLQSTLLSAVVTTARSAGLTNTVPFNPTTQMSVTSDASGLRLSGDVTSPGTLQFYGTNAAGTRAWLPQTSILKVTFSRKTASYTLVLADAYTQIEMNVASANNLTVPLNSSVAFEIGTQILISQYGAGQTTIVATGGVTIRSSGGKLKIGARYAAGTLEKVGTDEWYLFGELAV